MTKKFTDYLQYFKHKILGSPKLKQELLLRLALKEKGFNLRKLKISIDHKTGANYINGVKVGIKYPDSFFLKSGQMIPLSKTVSYYFNGNMSDSGGRKLMLKPFVSMQDAIVVESDDGRIEDRKDKFNPEYFQGLANAKFGLCPHQADWIGNEESLWTYRFVECCFVGAIPVLFRKAPLSEKFTLGFYYQWDDTLLGTSGEVEEMYDASEAQFNRDRARELFCFTEEECIQIRNTCKSN